MPLNNDLGSALQNAWILSPLCKLCGTYDDPNATTLCFQVSVELIGKRIIQKFDLPTDLNDGTQWFCFDVTRRINALREFKS